MLGRKRDAGYEDAKVEVSIPDLLDEIGATYDNRRRVFCPLCDDEGSRNPGASYTADEMRYKCWVCGFGGDVTALAREWLANQKDDIVSMKEALEWLRQTFRF